MYWIKIVLFTIVSTVPQPGMSIKCDIIIATAKMLQNDSSSVQ